MKENTNMKTAFINIAELLNELEMISNEKRNA